MHPDINKMQYKFKNLNSLGQKQLMDLQPPTKMTATDIGATFNNLRLWEKVNSKFFSLTSRVEETVGMEHPAGYIISTDKAATRQERRSRLNNII